MSIFKCKMCGGTIEFEQGATVSVCDYCGTKQTLPRLDDDRRANLYDRANHFRRNNDFDKAAGIYEQILSEDSTDAEAYWSLVLCRYGIEYVEDPKSHKRIPTVNRAQFTSVFDDDNYKSALQYADVYQRGIYEEEANTINDIQKGILAISQKEEPFDVFICYKETDNNGRRTQDSVLANELYHQLTQEGFKVFFSRITLEDKLGTAYEPYIFAALNSAKVMVVLGTKPEYFNAVWVKNEWSRYLSLVKKSGGKKMLIPAYKDMDPYDLPEEFSHLQAQDMSKLGFMQDLIRGIKKIISADEPKATVKETVVVNTGNTNIAPLLKRAFMFLEDGNWQEADEYCEKVLDIDPECAEAYLGKLMAQLRVSKKANLKNCAVPFDDKNNYKKAIRFGDNELVSLLNGCTEYIKGRNENDRLCGIYNEAKSSMENAADEEALVNAAEKFNSISGFKDSKELAAHCQELADTKHYDGIYNSAKAKMDSNESSDVEAAAYLFEQIPGWRDSDELARQCFEKAEICRKDAIYSSAKSRMFGKNVVLYKEAIKRFQTIPGWKDSDEQICICQKEIYEMEKRAAARLERGKKQAKKRKKILIIGSSVVCACIAFIILLTTVIIPNSKYNAAMKLYSAGKYEEAITAFAALDGYKDSKTQIDKCNTAIKYNAAMELYNAGKYEAAIIAFRALDGYKDSASQIDKCNTAIKDSKYNAAMKLYNAGKYEAALTAFKALNGYKDSANQVNKCNTAIKDSKYNAAMKLYNAGKYAEALTAFKALNGYKDSAGQIDKCNTAIMEGKYDAAMELYNAGKYDEAAAAFEALNGYKDSADKTKECLYIEATNLRNEKNWDAANKLFEQIKDYKDSKDLLHYHNFVKTDSKAATCTSAGYIDFACSCGETLHKDIAAKGHKYSTATCTTPKKCTRCGATSGSALGHTTYEITCLRCGVLLFKSLSYSGAGDKLIDGINLPNGKFKITLKVSSDGYSYFYGINDKSGRKLYVDCSINMRFDLSNETSFIFDGPLDNGYIQLTGNRGTWAITIEAF